MARALLLLEQRGVDLAPEDLVDAAHEAAPGLLVVVDVQRGAVTGDASGGMHQAIAEAAAVPAFVLYRWAEWGRHRASLGTSGLAAGLTPFRVIARAVACADEARAQL